MTSLDMCARRSDAKQAVPARAQDTAADREFLGMGVPRKVASEAPKKRPARAAVVTRFAT